MSKYLDITSLKEVFNLLERYINNRINTKMDKFAIGTGLELTESGTLYVTLDTSIAKIVITLPETPAIGDDNKIHFVPSGKSGDKDIYSEYIWLDNKWEKVGDFVPDVDLSSYLNKNDIEERRYFSQVPPIIGGPTYGNISTILSIDGILTIEDKPVINFNHDSSSVFLRIDDNSFGYQEDGNILYLPQLLYYNTESKDLGLKNIELDNYGRVINYAPVTKSDLTSLGVVSNDSVFNKSYNDVEVRQDSSGDLKLYFLNRIEEITETPGLPPQITVEYLPGYGVTLPVATTSSNGLMPKLPTENMWSKDSNELLLNGAGKYANLYVSYNFNSHSINLSIEVEDPYYYNIIASDEIPLVNNFKDGLMPKVNKYGTLEELNSYYIPYYYVSNSSGDNDEAGWMNTSELLDKLDTVTNTSKGLMSAEDKVKLDGAVTGPASSTDNHIATFNGATGKIIKDSGVTASGGNVTATKFIKSGGTSAQFLKADGSVDGNSYLTTHQSLANYVTLNGALTITGQKTFNNANINLSSSELNILHSNVTASARGINFYNHDKSIVEGGIGSLLGERLYIGWGERPWDIQNCLAVSSTVLKYKNIDILTADNYSSVLDSRYYTESEVNTKLTNGSVTKVGTASKGSATQPIYLNAGVPAACTYTLGKSVPSNAVFTDTVYTHPTSSGNKHIPSGGHEKLILTWKSDGEALWKDLNSMFTGMEEILAYGVEWDITVEDPHLTRIGNMSLHKTLPILSQLRGCIAQGDKVIYWLDEDNWKYKKGGNPDKGEPEQLARLDGYDGTVRIYCPSFYIKSESIGNKRRVWISTVKIDNTWTYQHEILIDAYRSTVLNTIPLNMGYLSTLPVNSAISVVNTHDYCRGGGNRSANDAYLETDPFKSDLCKPRTNLSRATMRTYSRNASSEMLSYDLYKNIFYWLYVVEYANFNCLEAYNEQLTSEGYHQGGMGPSITNVDNTKWNEYNGYYPITPCGYGNDLGNGTGLKTIVLPVTSSKPESTHYMARWRGFDNPFGDIRTNLDGIIIQGNAEGNPKTVYTTTDPNNYGDNEVAKNAMEIAGHEIHKDGYTKEFDLGNAAHIIPESVGGDITKYKCDYHWAGSKDASLRTLLVGGTASNGAYAGLGYFYSHGGVSISSAHFGFRSVSSFVSFSE